MTPLTEKKRTLGQPSDSLHPPHDQVRSPSRKEKVLGKAQTAWKLFSKDHTNLSVPHWYSGVHGVPNRLLRLPSHKLTEKEKGLCLLVRMNYILDYQHYFNLVPRETFLYVLPARRIRSFCRSFGPIWKDGVYLPMMAGGHERFNTSYAISNNYDWRRALACTVGNFVHLLILSKESKA